jgi:sarcosine oxidase subunit alpha
MPTPDTLEITVNGKRVAAPNGASVAAAVAIAGETSFRRSVSGEPRSPLCGMGVCFECRVTIDGVAHCRSCQIECRQGMQVST